MTPLGHLPALARRVVLPRLGRRAPAFDAEAVTQVLGRLGVRSGGVLLVHVGFAPDLGFTGTPVELIEALRRALGPDGTLCMMSMPFTGQSAEAYLTSPEHRPFHVRRTMSKVGIVTEVFRRMPGVRRLLHPTHPVCVLGPAAESLCADVPDLTPFGPRGFFARLVEQDAQMLLLGVGFRRLTFEHYLEDAIEPWLPAPLYGPPLRTEVIDAENRPRTVEVLALTPEISARRRTARLELLLRATGRLRSTALGACEVHLCDARPVLAVVRRAVRLGWRFHV
jgi:aminoglycoside 3-N-acetyltransferase